MTTALPLASLAAADPDPAALLAGAMDLLTTAARVMAPSSAPLGAATPRVVTPPDALRELVRGQAGADPDQLGIPVADGRLTVITGPDDVLLRLRALAPALNRAVEVLLATEWLILIPGVPRISGVDVGRRDAMRLLQHLRRCGLRGWRAGISSALRTREQLPAAYRDAADAAALAEVCDDNVVAVDDVWARLAVTRLQSVVKAALPARSPVDALVEHDREHNSDFHDSLSAWLRANADTRAAAAALGVHPNTLRYRVRRAAEIAGLDLDDPHQRLVLQLARLRD